MEFIEMIAWLCVGFIPTLGLGNMIWSWVDKKKRETNSVVSLTEAGRIIVK